MIAQGRGVLERAVADPDALAELPLVQAAAADGIDLEGEDMLGIAWNAHLSATGDQLPTSHHHSLPGAGPQLEVRFR
ncbi:DUF4240 domain-containing protein [Streptomyces sp. NPDC046316]|uniref:DUF4240 domain-containing protein n=1 Tax=Streptomyces sp. NPDC046316 TaxID=3154494 RepID=UPI0033F65E86